MKRYPVYKQEHRLPGIEEVPEHWGVVRNSLIFREMVETGYGDLELLSILSDKGIVKQSETGRKERAPEDRNKYKRIQKGDIGYNLMNAFMGSIGVSNYEGIISPAYAVCRPKTKIDPNYFHYLFRTDLYLTEFDRNAYGIMYERNRLYFENFKKIYVPLPPHEEQKTIAQFLDYKIEQIELYIRNKQRLIELLNEQKIAIINRAVTKGINPELTRIFLEKDLIDVNSESCQLISIRNLRRMGILEIQDGNHGELHPTSTDYVEEGIPFLMANDIRNGQVNLKSCTFITKEKADKLRIGFSKPKDILLTHKGTVGETAIVPDNIGFPYIMLTPQVTYYRVLTKAINPIFLCYCFQSSFFQEQLKIIGSKQSTRAFVGIVAQRDLIIILPAKKEQDKICNFLDNETFKINQVIAQVEKEIELIQEYRTTLISDAVTGKIDVRSTSAIETTLTA